MKSPIRLAAHALVRWKALLWLSFLVAVLLFSMGCGISFGHLGSAAP